jgi:hypothetical protein
LITTVSEPSGALSLIAVIVSAALDAPAGITNCPDNAVKSLPAAALPDVV